MSTARFWALTSSEIRIVQERGGDRDGGWSGRGITGNWSKGGDVGGGVPSWTPEELFQANELGAWFDAADLSTLWQDAARTTPVTADGDPVGAWDDKSGNDNHATQATASKRPIYHTSGGLHWIESDGTDDYFTIARLFIDATADTSMGFAMSLEAEASSPYFFGTTGLDKGFELLLSGSTEKPQPAAITVGGTITGVATDALVVGAKHTFIQEWDRSAGSLTLDKDGIQIVDVSGTPSNLLLPVEDYELFSGATGTAARCIAVKLYGFVIISRALTAGEKTNLKDWLDGKAGI